MKKLVVGNLKMNLLSPRERDLYLATFKKKLAHFYSLKGNKKKEVAEIVLCPPFVHLEAFKKWNGKNVKLGAQDVFAEAKGAYTGEISPEMLKNFGCEYVMVGHSERRRYFSENDHEINLKVLGALRAGLVPIICIGETKEERENGSAGEVITRQLTESLKGVSRTKAEKIVIASEPAWAAGTDVVPTTNEIMEAKVLIKKILVGLFGKKYAEKVRIIYGGSIHPQITKQVCLDPGMDGGLVGRESLAPHEFMKIFATLSEDEMDKKVKK